MQCNKTNSKCRFCVAGHQQVRESRGHCPIASPLKVPQLSVPAQLPPLAKFQLFSKSAAAFAQLAPVVLAIAYFYLHSTQDYNQQIFSVKTVINFHQRGR